MNPVRSIGPFHSRTPIVIAHRGASGRMPEQTLEAFDLALDQGADAIELDVVPTRDRVLIARHENELSLTTDVADHGEFESRRLSRGIEGNTITGWFAEHFLAAEIRTLRARQRFPFRDHLLDDRFTIPTLDEVLEWLISRRKALGRPIGLFIEIKHPTHFVGIKIDVADLLLRMLASHNLLGADAGVVAMSFETRVLRGLRSRTDLPLVQLLDAGESQPFDWNHAGDERTYADMITPAGLAEIARYANGIGPWKRLIVPAESEDKEGGAGGISRLAGPTSLITDAHAAGLFVCSWTFRDEGQFLASNYAGDPKKEYEQFYQLGLDGVITDFPETAVAARGVSVPSPGTPGEG